LFAEKVVVIDKRKFSLAELVQAEEIFLGNEVTNHFENGCPWCDGALNLEDFGAAYKIWCEKCDFSVSSRGF
jgi:hypothetical protein